MSKVYVLTNDSGVILRIDGGYSTPADLTGWTLIDEGEGDRYNLCQSHYLPELTDEYGVPRYRLAGGEIVERTAEEMEADRPAESAVDADRGDPGELAELEWRVSDLEGAFDVLMRGETND